MQTKHKYSDNTIFKVSGYHGEGTDSTKHIFGNLSLCIYGPCFRPKIVLKPKLGARMRVHESTE